MRNDVKDKIIKLIPDIPCVKCAFAKLRVRRVEHRLLPEEDVVKCEADFGYKESLVDNKVKNTKNKLSSIIRMANEILDECYKDLDEAERHKIYIDIIFCRLAYGFLPEEYLCFELSKQDINQREQWVSDFDRYKYIFSLNDIKDSQVFNNKNRLYRELKEFYKRDAVGISKAGDLGRFQAFVEKHPVFVKKQVYEGCGRSIELVDINHTNKSLEDTFYELIGQGEHILEERIYNDPYVSALNPSSVNTVRCITFNTKNGIDIPFCFMKIGRNGSFVDNGGAGGLLVGVDRNTGKLSKYAFDERNVRYDKHPDSGVVFDEITLPNWGELLDICKEISVKFPSVKCIGWDFAYTCNGWVIVEGNGMTQLIGPQITEGGPIKEQIESIMNNIELFV